MRATVAYLGPEHTNTHAAARAAFGPRCAYVHAPTVEEVFRVVEREDAQAGVVPVENSLEGAVTHTLDRFIEFRASPVKIVGELEQPIRHYFLTRRGTRRERVRVVYSHPQALAQCRRWLARSCPTAVLRETNSTAEAVGRLMAHDNTWRLNERAAISRRELAAPRGLAAVPIPVARDNRTRFLVLGLGDPQPARRNKTSLMFSLKDRAGALHDALLPFKRHRINLTKIESRPSKQRAWEYYFFVDLEGHAKTPTVAAALKELARQCTDLNVLGSYPIS